MEPDPGHTGVREPLRPLPAPSSKAIERLGDSLSEDRIDGGIRRGLFPSTSRMSRFRAGVGLASLLMRRQGPWAIERERDRMLGRPAFFSFSISPLRRPHPKRLALGLTAALMALGLSLSPTGPGRAGPDTETASAPTRLAVPLLVPVTGFLALEGRSQRDGALLALEQAQDSLPAEVTLDWEVLDTGTSPEVAVNALMKSLGDDDSLGAVASIFGPQMLAMMPVAARHQLPLLTISGTAALTERGNAHVFRFFPSDAVVKEAQARYVAEELAAQRPAVLYQTTAYGQSGRDKLAAAFERLGTPVVHEAGLAPSVKDMLPALTSALATQPDVLVLQLHSGPTALLVRQRTGHESAALPVVAGSAMHQPSTAALVEPTALAEVCAESGSSPVSGGSDRMRTFLDAYRQRFEREPDAFALAQYDAVQMLLAAIRAGVRDRQGLRDYLASQSHDGIAMRYRSDGKGNMAHDAVILCYDGQSRVPKVVKRYENVDGIQQ